jgi:hypothetical protein
VSAVPSLLERLRAARETWARLSGEVEVCIRRPTDLDLALHRDRDAAAWLRATLCDWRGVREMDLVPGGSGKAAPFDAEVAVEWLSDRPDDFLAAWNAWQSMIEAHLTARADAEKK